VTNPLHNDDTRYTAAEAAEWLHVSVQQIYKLCKNGELGHFRIGSKVIVPESALKAFDAASWVAPVSSVVSIKDRRAGQAA